MVHILTQFKKATGELEKILKVALFHWEYDDSMFAGLALFFEGSFLFCFSYLLCIERKLVGESPLVCVCVFL